MRFEYRYYGATSIDNGASSTALRFAPDTLRPPVWFDGCVNRRVPFREAMSALHDVVTADGRYQAPDKTAYKAWLAANEEVLLAEFQARSSELRARQEPLLDELRTIRTRKEAVLKPFQKAQAEFFSYIYLTDRSMWLVLDPVITVHPDRVFFECFSRDESSYAALSCDHEMFDHAGDVACGTTNIDYSEALYDEFQKIRDYKTTRLTVDPGGFQVKTADDPAFVEEKIDVPDSWVRGFLQVSSAMNLPARRLDLHPMDLHNFCMVLRRRRERAGPRSIRFVLVPGEPVRAVFEPWNTEIVCRRSVYQGGAAEEIRIWGRRRLLSLERLIPLARGFTLHLLGTGMPSFWIADLPGMRFTLGLSGWIANDWSRSGQFDLLAPRGDVDADSKARVYGALARRWFAGADQLAADTGLARTIVERALALYTQAGRVIYDLAHGVYRLRELARDPLPLDLLRFANPAEQEAEGIVALHALDEAPAEGLPGGAARLTGIARSGDRRYRTMLVIDADQRIVDGACECNQFSQHRLRQGPCAHMLALRLSHARREVVA